jgi:hypothetical protein
VLRYLKLIGLFQDVTDTYKAEQGKDKPAWMSRKVIGALLLFLAVAAETAMGTKIDPDILTNLGDNLAAMAPAIVGIYGAVMALVGIFKNARVK